MLRKLIEKVLKNYTVAKKDNYSDNELARSIRVDLPEFLEKITENNFLYIFDGSAGRGMWANCPYVAILDKKITTSVQSGYFPVYLFREDMKGVYLSLMYGTGDFKSKFADKAKEELIFHASKCRESHPTLFKNFNQTDINLATDSPNSLASFYEAGNIAAKYYEIDNLPSEEKLQSDYWEMLDIYNDITGTKPDFLGIRDFIQKMLENYLDAKNAKNLAKELNSHFANKGDFQNYIIDIAEQSESAEYDIYGFFGGFNKFIPLPWLNIYRKKYEYPFFISFEFREDMEGVYLSLTDSYQSAEKSMIKEDINFEKFDKTFQDYISKRASNARNILYRSTKIREDFIENIDLNSQNATSASSREAANVFAKYYTLNNLPSEKELVSDFKEILRLYELLINDNLPHLNIKSFLEHIFKSYQHAKNRGDPVKNHKLSNIFNEFARDLQNYVNYPEVINDLKRYNSYTHYQSGGSWDNRPYITLTDLNSSKYLLSYSFTERTQGVHLSLELNWGYMNRQSNNVLNRSPTLEERNKFVKLETAKISAFLRQLTLVPNDFESSNLQSGVNSIYSIFTKYYDKTQLPSEEQFKTDLQEMIRLYDIVSHSREDLTVLSDADEISDAQELFKTIFTKMADETIEAPTQSRRFPLLWSKELGIWGYFGDVENHYFNPFGVGKPDLSLDNKTVCEINSPHKGIKRTTSGVFAKNSSGQIFLLHRGIFHGLKIKKDEIDRVEILDGDQKSELILIGGLEEPDFLEKLKKFVFKVNHIKNGGNGVNVLNFFEYLSKEGYFFDPKIVENYLLSLKVKPFVILTGNSGTGKTKVAQLFAKYLNSKKVKKGSMGDPVTIKNSNKVKSRYLSANDYIIKNHGGWTLNTDELNYLEGFLDDFTLATYDPVNKKIQTGQGHITNNKLFCTIDNPFFDFLKSIKHDFKTIYFIKEKYDPDMNLTEYLIKIEDEYGEKYEIIPVGANWTENRHIIGFYNVITGEYNETSALNLVLTAEKDHAEPYFLILDEMNLSHVERYFSDFLSAMESNEDVKLHSNNDLTFPPSKIKLPFNLFVIGTVNVDETTYMFSPKVLDRANTLEFLTQPAADYMSNSPKYNVDGDLDYLLNPLSDIELRDENINNLKNKLLHVRTQNNLLIWDLLASKINEFQDVLKEADFDFGFRTINEIIRFMIVSWKYEGQNDIWDNWERYFDSQILQKMLPKLHGSQRELDMVLKNLRELCDESDETIFPCSAQKLDKMLKRLSEKRYVAFTG